MEKIVTCEQVFKGHPDKVADQIADSILDDFLEHDLDSEVAIEVAIKNKAVYVVGEVFSNYECDYKSVVRKVLESLDLKGDYLIYINVSKQSEDIRLGLKKNGAGDQGMMYGYATDETDEFLPLPYVITNRIAKRCEEIAKKYSKDFRYDGKCLVSVIYQDDEPIKVSDIVVSIQTRREIENKVLKEFIKKEVIDKVLVYGNYNLLVNPTGAFIKGGPEADSGLTGRKIIADTYGGVAHHGGGSFSGKSITKVDRSGAYYARYVAKSLVKAGLCKRCEVGVSYAIGVNKPIAISVTSFNTSKFNDDELLKIIKRHFDFSVTNIIEELRLRGFIYFALLTCFGHFGKEGVAWEDVDGKVKEIQESL